MSFNFDPIKSPPFNPHKVSGGGNVMNMMSSFEAAFVDEQVDKFVSNSVSLSCLSPDSKSLHSLLRDGTIVTRFLPLHDTSSSAAAGSGNSNDNGNGNHEEFSDKNNSNKSIIKSITTHLPSHMIRSFKVDPPLEIICVDNDTPSKIMTHADKSKTKLLPLICIYTLSSAFVIQIQYDVQSDAAADAQPNGSILQVQEPFEAHLTTTSSQIRRIRPAPHSYMYNSNTFQTMCNKGAMVMLTSNADVVLFHGYKSINQKHDSLLQLQPEIQFELQSYSETITISATVSSEQTDMTPLADFCFLPSSPSNSHSIWNAISILLSTQNGSLYVLSPIVFHGTVFAQNQIEEGKEFLLEIIDKYDFSPSKGAECRRARAALQFFQDAFVTSMRGGGNGAKNDKYIKANILHHELSTSATMWPVGLQPIYTAQGEDYSGVECMELLSPPSTSGSALADCGMCGVVLARNDSLEYMLIPAGENLIPRYAFESGEDTKYLDGLLCGSAMVMEEVVFGEEDDEVYDGDGDSVSYLDRGRKVVLVSDPVDKTMMHRVSEGGVVSVTTNVLSIMEGRLIGITGRSTSISGQDTIKTNAWASISIVKGALKELNGIVISGDAQFGHVLVAVLTDGTTESMNVTAALYLNEARNQLDMERSDSLLTLSDEARENDEALKAMLSITPLHEQIKPHFDKISTGLSSMSKIIGGSTDPRNITPGTLATFLATKQSSEQNIILPLKELNSLVEARQKYLLTVREHQIEQIEKLKEMVKTLKERMEATNKKKTILEANSNLLSEQSAAVLTTARDLSPGITESERQYFKDIKRYEANCDKYESSVEVLRSEHVKLRQNSHLGVEDIRLSGDQANLCQNLLDGQNELLLRVQSEVKMMENKAETLAVACGLEDERKPLVAISGDNN